MHFFLPREWAGHPSQRTEWTNTSHAFRLSGDPQDNDDGPVLFTSKKTMFIVLPCRNQLKRVECLFKTHSWKGSVNLISPSSRGRLTLRVNLRGGRYFFTRRKVTTVGAERRARYADGPQIKYCLGRKGFPYLPTEPWCIWIISSIMDSPGFCIFFGICRIYIAPILCELMDLVIIF